MSDNITITIPSVDSNKECITDDGVIISNCTIDEKGNIKGFTPDNVKALFSVRDKVWYFGKDIGRSNLIDLSLRTEEERKRIGALGAKKRDENRDAKRNINELAKAMLEQALSDRQKREIVGERDYTLDNTLASALLNAMVNSALDGSFKAFESVRDTAGFKPKNEVEIQADIMTESDRMLIDKVAKTG